MTTEAGALLILSSGSWEASVVRRNARERLEVSRLKGVFPRARYVFFPVEEERVREIDESLTVHQVRGGEPPGPLARLAWLRRAWLLVTGYGRIRRVAEESDVAAVYAVDPFLSGLVGLLLSRRLGVPLAVAVVSNYRLSYRAGGVNPMPAVPAPVAFALERWVLARAGLVLADREFYREYALSRGARPERVRIAPCYADPAFHDAEPDPGIWERLGIEDPRPVVYVGRLSPEKYSLELLEAFARVAETSPDRHLVVLGGEGPLREEFLAGARERGLVERVHIREGLEPDEVFSGLAGAGVVLAPHAGYALLEAALAAAPIVAYDFEWHPEVVEDGVTGRLVPYRDPRAMARAALELLEEPERARALGAEARRRCRERHRIARTVEELEAHFRWLLRSGREGR